ncbi:MAG: CoA transferase [Actinocatenispora sp.]
MTQQQPDADGAAGAGPRAGSTGALSGVRVLDLATLFAGPMAAMFLGDFGAEVIKVEHPERPDPSRGHGASRDGIGLWWKILGRNKRTMTVNLSTGAGQDLLVQLVRQADVVIENFRPGTLERWNLGYERLAEANPGLVLARVTGFGQFGPYARRPGFGTLAEAMSGFAAMTGEPDGPPTLPPFGLADGIAGLATAYAVMVALRSREATGRGQVVDLSIIEPILTVLGAQPTVYDQLGVIPPRTGNRSTNNAPRNTYRCADGSWVAVSTSAQTIAERVVRLVGRPDFAAQPWFASGEGRVAHADELDAAVADWVARRDRDEVLAAFDAAQAAVAPVYDVADVLADPQLAALDAITTVPDPELGPVRMQNVMFRLSDTPGEVRWAGTAHGAHTDAILTEHGLSTSDIAALRDAGAI